MKLITYSIVVIGLVAAARAGPARGGADRGGPVRRQLSPASISACRSTSTASAPSGTRPNVARFQIAGEALGGIKDVKLLGLETHFLQRFQGPARQVAEATRRAPSSASCRATCSRRWPSAALLAFVLFLLVTGSELDRQRSCRCSRSTPSPAIRIFPALQRIYVSMTQMRFSKPTLDKLHKDMRAAEANMRALPARRPALGGAPRPSGWCSTTSTMPIRRPTGRRSAA